MASYHYHPQMASYHPHYHPTTTPCYSCCCHHLPPQDPPLPPPPPQPHFPTNPHHFQQPQIPPHQEDPLQPILTSLLHRIATLETSLLKLHSNSLRHSAARVIQTHFRNFLLHRSTTLGHLKNLASIKSNLNALKSSLNGNPYIDCNLLYAKATNLLLRLDSIQGGDPMIRDGKMSISRELNQFLKLIDGVSLKKSELSRKIVKNVRCGGDNRKPKVVYSDKRGGNGETLKVGRRGDGTVKVREQMRRIGELDMVDESDGEEYEELDRLHEELGRLEALLARKKGVSNSRTGGIRLHDGSQAKAKKSVHFADNEKAYRVIRSRNEPVLMGECDSDDDNNGNLGDTDQFIDNHSRETQESDILSQEKEDDEEEAQTEDEGSPPSSNGGSDVTFSSISKADARRTSYDQSEDGSFTFSAPLPVLMEPRADLMSRAKFVK